MEKKNINEVIANLSVEQLVGMTGHTFLKSFETAENIEELCAEIRQYQFAVVAINSAGVETCVELLESSGVCVGVATGFSLGQNTVECKAFKTRDAITKGVTEIDTVVSVRALQKGQTDIVRKEIEDIVSVCKPAGVTCRVVLGTCYLTDEEKETICYIAKETGMDFVKMSTGFGTAGANMHDIILMRRVIGPMIGMKAAGGIRDLDTTLILIQVGAARIGTSSGIQIVEAYKGLRKGLQYPVQKGKLKVNRNLK